MYSLIKYICYLTDNDVAKIIYKKYAKLIFESLWSYYESSIDHIIIEDYKSSSFECCRLCKRPSCCEEATRYVYFEFTDKAYYNQRLCSYCFKALFGIVYNFKV